MKALCVAVALVAAPLAASAQVGPKPPMKDPPKMTVAVTVKETPTRKDPKILVRTLRGSGEAAYPDGTALQFGIRMKDDQLFIMRTQGFVTGGKWDIELPAVGDDIYLGTYVCQIDFDPEHQAPGILPKIPSDKRQAHSAAVEQKIGTDEGIAKETAMVHGYYKLKLEQLHLLIDPILAEFRAQLTTKDEAKWNEMTSKASEEFFKIDREISTFRKRRRNVLSVKICDELCGLILSTRDYALEDFWEAIDKGVSKLSGAESQERAIKTLFERLDAALVNATAAPLPEQK
jgi:hypothetical protein